MPIFEYICRNCGKEFEKLTSTQQRDRAECVICGSEKTARKISQASPARIKTASVSAGGDCGAPSCCGGGCMLPN